MRNLEYYLQNVLTELDVEENQFARFKNNTTKRSTTGSYREKI
jgi:hypothetical protein